jgi:hypothetical protein
MPALVLQRYLLIGQPAAATSVPANGTSNTSVITAPVPLGSTWTVRVRWVYGQAFSTDATGQIQVQCVAFGWQWRDTNSNILFQLTMGDAMVTPYWTFPKATGVNGLRAWDADQTVSSVDIIGGVPVSVNAFVSATVLNLDGALAHPYNIQCGGILEFEAPGSSE